MYERKTDALLPRREFLGRLLHSFGAGLVLILLSLLAGMGGYRVFEQLSWVDAFLNAAMLLGGMGPITPPVTVAGKLFAGFYALYCGLVVVLAAGIVFAPLVHRFLHRFHLEHGRVLNRRPRRCAFSPAGRT